MDDTHTGADIFPEQFYKDHVTLMSLAEINVGGWGVVSPAKLTQNQCKLERGGNTVYFLLKAMSSFVNSQRSGPLFLQPPKVLITVVRNG